MAEDPFPRERVGATLRRMPAYLKLSWRLARDPLLSRARRAAVIAAAGYLASPIDLVPGVIPVVGQLDDIAFAIAALKLALSGLDPVRRRAHLESVGLGDDDLSRRPAHRRRGKRLARPGGCPDDWPSGEARRQGGRGRREGSGDRREGGRDRCEGGRPGDREDGIGGCDGGIEGRARGQERCHEGRPGGEGRGSKAGPAARGAASRGMAAARGATSWGSAAKLRVSVRRAPALGPGADSADDLLPVEPDVIELPAPRDPTGGNPRKSGDDRP